MAKKVTPKTEEKPKPATKPEPAKTEAAKPVPKRNAMGFVIYHDPSKGGIGFPNN